MRVVTFNLWHGLSPASPLAFEALEPAGRRVLREELQIATLRSLKPDFCFLQEVNPVQSRMDRLQKELGMEGHFQPDLVGLKVLGMGLPINLNSGLAIMAAKKWGLKWAGSISLSRPGFNWVRGWASWQLKEERFALFTESLVPGWGKVLLVNTHLHHGLEATPEFMAEIEKLAEAEELNSAFVSEVKQRVKRANIRRLSEMEILLREWKRLESRYAATILCGDFNAEPESEIFHPLREMGFVDAWAAVRPEDPGRSFDPMANEANHLLQASFPVTLVLEDLTFSAKVKERLLSLARQHDNRSRRIDYVWVRTAQPVAVTNAALVGRPDADGFAPSDHFGVCIDLGVPGGQSK